MSAEQVAFAQYLATIRPGITYMFRGDVADIRWVFGVQDYRSRNYEDSLRRASDLYTKAGTRLMRVKAPRALRASQRDAAWDIVMFGQWSSNFTGWITHMRVGVAEGDPITRADWKQGYKEFENAVIQDRKATDEARAAWLDDIVTEAQRLGVPWPQKWFITLNEKLYKASHEALGRALAD